MLKLVRRGIVANLGRLILTLISVTLGVAFVSGSFVLADSLRAIFNQVSEDAFAGVDAQVQAVEPELNSGQNLVRFDGSLVDEIAALDEVEYAEGGLFVFEQTYTQDADGEIVRPQGPPVFSGSWGGPSPASAFTLIEGEAPVGQQIAVDEAQAEAGGFSVGDLITVTVPIGEPEQFELSGLIDFGEGGTGGAFFILYDLPSLQRVLGIEGNQVDSIVVTASPGTDGDDLLAAIESKLPDGLEVLSSEEVIADQQEQFGTIIDIFGNILLGFAVVVLFVSIFIIYNTFAILVGQRTKQLGLLRSIGASGPQIRAMVLIEAVIIGVAASIVGLFGGVGVAWLLKQLFSTGGGSFPDGPLRILPRTIVVVVVVGLLVTVLSAILPAIRASRVSPLEAVRDGGQRERSMRFRILAGAAVLVPGLVALLFGMFGDIEGTTPRLASIGIGAALTFLGVAMLSALFAGQAAAVLGLPAEAIKGITGRLARDNASRNPQRTAATATALMIGLALITGVAVLTESLLRTFDEILEESITADLFVLEEAQGLPFSSVVVDQLAALPEVGEVTGFAAVEARINDNVESLSAYDTETGSAVVNIGVVEGAVEGPVGLGTDGIAVLAEKAETLGLAIGDTVSIELEDGFTTDLTVEAIYDEDALVGAAFVVDRDLTSPHLNVDNVGIVGLTYSEGVDPEVGRAAVEEVTTNFAQLGVQDNTELQEQTRDQVGQLQIVINGLLVLCLVVAFFGIVNTMALSILERIREIGLLRAVGTTRRQLRTAVRWEAVIVAVFGSLLGIAMGLLLGWTAVVAIPDTFISKVGIPWLSLAIYLLVGAVLGVIAAFFPATRAARMNVLDAIAYE